MTKRSLTALIVAVMMMACFSVYAGGKTEEGAEGGKEFPSRPIDIVVGALPGGTTDVAARALSATAPPFLNDVDINVVNMPGGGMMIAMKHVQSEAKPDGYTLMVSYGEHHQKTILGLDLPVNANPDPEIGDFQPVIGSLGYTSALVVPYDSPFETLEDLVEYGKANAGELSWGHTGAYGAHDMMGRSFLAEADIEAEAVPLEGGPATRQAVTGGHVDFGVLATFLVPDFLKDKLMRALAVFSPERDPIAPDTPTFRELGYSDVLDEMLYKNIGAPSGVPEERIQILYEGFKKATETAAFKAMLESQGLIVLGWSPEECRERSEAYDAVIKKLLDKGVLQKIE